MLKIVFFQSARIPYPKLHLPIRSTLLARSASFISSSRKLKGMLTDTWLAQIVHQLMNPRCGYDTPLCFKEQHAVITLIVNINETHLHIQAQNHIALLL